jgi:hypothetical protein
LIGRASGFAGKRICPVDQHPDLPPGAAQPYRNGKNLRFVVGHALQYCRSDIEQCGEPARAEVNGDLIGRDIDAFDQGGKEGTLACSGQLGPSLPDLGGSRDEPVLR